MRWRGTPSASPVDRPPALQPYPTESCGVWSSPSVRAPCPLRAGQHRTAGAGAARSRALPLFFDGRRRRRRIRDVLRWALAAPCWARCWRSVAPRRQAATMELGRVRPISDATNGPEVPVAVATSRWTRSGARQRCTCASCACYVCHTPLQPRTLFFISQQHPHSRSAEGAKRTLHRPTHTRKMVCRQL
jgi:hypothetical protein